jgi:signal transduction histidine kinase
VFSRFTTRSTLRYGSALESRRSVLRRAVRGAEPLLLPAAGAMLVGLHALTAGQVWRRLLLPTLGPLQAPPVNHRASRLPAIGASAAIGPSAAIGASAAAGAPGAGGTTVTFAHELRRRLAALRMLSEAIEVRSGEADRERLVHMLVRELHDLEQLESAMLDSSLRDTNEEVEVLEVAQAAAQTVGWARKSKIKVQGSKRPLKVRSNPTMLRQALENLIDNAATCGAGEPVEVIVRYSMARRPAGIEVLVADRGPGLGKAPAHRRSGGVGLPLVRRFVHETGGRLWSHNRQGGGAVFGVWLPASLATTNGTNGTHPTNGTTLNGTATNGTNGRAKNGTNGRATNGTNGTSRNGATGFGHEGGVGGVRA